MPAVGVSCGDIVALPSGATVTAIPGAGARRGAAAAKPAIAASAHTQTHRVGRDVRRRIPSTAAAATASNAPTSNT